MISRTKDICDKMETVCNSTYRLILVAVTLFAVLCVTACEVNHVRFESSESNSALSEQASTHSGFTFGEAGRSGRTQSVVVEPKRTANEEPDVVVPSMRLEKEFDSQDRTSYPSNYGFTPFYEKYKSSVVQLDSYKDLPLPGQKRRGVYHGTGFFVKPNVVCTDLHAVNFLKNRVVLRTDSGQLFDTKVAGIDKADDLAFLKVLGNKTFAPLPLGETTYMSWRSPISCIGYPKGLGILFFTPGSLQLQKPMKEALSNYQELFSETTPDKDVWIALMRTEPGNSGSPVFDEEGSVVGIIEGGNGVTAIMRSVEDIIQAEKKLGI